MDRLYPFGKNRYLMMIAVLSAINVAYYVITFYFEGTFSVGMNLVIAVLGYAVVIPMVSAIPAAIIALIPTANASYKERWLRGTLGICLGINAVFVAVMLVTLFRDHMQ